MRRFASWYMARVEAFVDECAEHPVRPHLRMLGWFMLEGLIIFLGLILADHLWGLRWFP